MKHHSSLRLWFEFCYPGILNFRVSEESVSICFIYVTGIMEGTSRRNILCIFPRHWLPAAAKSLQLCPALCDPIDGSPLGSSVLGFSRQEHWSGLPFPPPMHGSEKLKWSRSVVHDSSQPHGLQPTRLLRPCEFLGKNAGLGCHCLLRLCNWPYVFNLSQFHQVWYSYHVYVLWK